MKVFPSLFISVFVFTSIFLAGCNNKNVKPAAKSLNESIQGHWKDKNGANYFISKDKFVLKNFNGSTQNFSYFITVVNDDINLVEIMLKTPDGDIGSICKIRFKDKDRKIADITTTKNGVGVGVHDVWTYTDSKMNP